MIKIDGLFMLLLWG